MESTDILKREHDLIVRGLNLLEAAVGQIHSAAPVPDGFQSWSISFIRNFSDHCHHAKEEDEFFPVLEQRGIPREGGPIGCMLKEHETGRDCVRRMAAANTGNDPAAFAAAASQYVSLLRDHIFKENNVLFMMASHCLSQQDDARLVEQFKAAEESKGLGEIYARSLAEVQQWEEVFRDVAPPAGNPR